MYIPPPPSSKKKKEIKKIKNNVPEQNESDYKTTAVQEPWSHPLHPLLQKVQLLSYLVNLTSASGKYICRTRTIA